MTTSTNSKVLRVALLQNGKIVEEFLHTSPQPLTLGEELSVTFLTPNLGLPPRFSLFQPEKEKTILSIPAWFQAKVSLEGKAPKSLQELQAHGLTKTIGFVSHPTEKGAKVPVLRMELPHTSRGKLTFGEHTLLFQFVPAPQEAPQETGFRLPGRFAMDWSFSMILLVSFVAHAGFITWLNNIGPLHAVSLRVLPTYIQKRLQEVYTPVFQPPVRRPAAKPLKRRQPTGNKSPKRRRTPEPKRRTTPQTPSKAGTKSPKKPLTREQLKQDVQGRGLLAVLNQGAAGTVFGSPQGVAIQVQQATRGLQQGMAAGQSQSYGVRRGTRHGKRLMDVPGMRTMPGTPKRIQIAKRKIKKIRSSMKITKLNLNNTTISASSLKRTIRRRIRSLQYCYERSLKTNHALKGRISFRITITKTGRARLVEIEDNELNREVARCMQKRLKRWLYPRPKTSEVEVLLPFLFVPAG